MDTLEDTTGNPTNTPDTATWMQLPLRAFLTGPDLPVTVTLTGSGLDAVVLGPTGTASVEVARDGRIVAEPDTLLAVAVSDPTRQAELLRAALSTDVAARQALAASVEQRATELAQLRVSQARTLAAVRDYAIGQYREDEIDRDVLDTLLDRLGVDPYQPRVKVTYTITGSFEVDSGDTDEVEENVEDYLRPDLGDVDNVVEDTDTYSVSVGSVEPVDD